MSFHAILLVNPMVLEVLLLVIPRPGVLDKECNTTRCTTNNKSTSSSEISGLVVPGVAKIKVFEVQLE